MRGAHDPNPFYRARKSERRIERADESVIEGWCWRALLHSISIFPVSAEQECCSIVEVQILGVVHVDTPSGAPLSEPKAADARAYKSDDPAS
jgi:hypothetical protein